MGRPREHTEETAAALLAAAERTVEAGGIDALSVRGVASDVGTTTRAVYSLFGSKDGLIAALGARVFDLLLAGLQAQPPTDDPVADLIAAGLMFRRVATDHPSLFAIGVQGDHLPNSRPTVVAAATTALDELKRGVARLADAGLLGRRSIDEAALEFHALCEGLAALELRGVLASRDAERIWRGGLTALVRGFAA